MANSDLSLIPSKSFCIISISFGNAVDGKAAALDTKVMKDLRSSHFKFNDTTNNFKTTSA